MDLEFRSDGCLLAVDVERSALQDLVIDQMLELKEMTVSRIHFCNRYVFSTKMKYVLESKLNREESENSREPVNRECGGTSGMEVEMILKNVVIVGD